MHLGLLVVLLLCGKPQPGDDGVDLGHVSSEKLHAQMVVSQSELERHSERPTQMLFPEIKNNARTRRVIWI